MILQVRPRWMTCHLLMQFASPAGEGQESSDGFLFLLFFPSNSHVIFSLQIFLHYAICFENTKLDEEKTYILWIPKTSCHHFSFDKRHVQKWFQFPPYLDLIGEKVGKKMWYTPPTQHPFPLCLVCSDMSRYHIMYINIPWEFLDSYCQLTSWFQAFRNNMFHHALT